VQLHRGARAGGPFQGGQTKTPADRLGRIKSLHSAIWVVFGGAKLSVPAFTSVGDLHRAL